MVNKYAVMIFGVNFCLCDICSHTFFFLDPETLLCLYFPDFFYLKKQTSSPSFFLISPPSQSFSFLRLPGFYAAWKSHNINECESVSGTEPHLLEPQPIKLQKPKCFFDTTCPPHPHPHPAPNVVAVLCLAQPKLSETQHPFPRSLPLKKWFF